MSWCIVFSEFWCFDVSIYVLSWCVVICDFFVSQFVDLSWSVVMLLHLVMLFCHGLCYVVVVLWCIVLSWRVVMA